MKNIKKKISKLSFFKSEFNINVAKVLTGTFIAQLIALLITPILTRIYTPEDFSNLAIYLSLVTILSVFATGKYDKAIILPKEDREAYSLMLVAGMLTMLVGSIFLLCFIIFKEQIIRLFDVDEISSWLIFIPITIFATALYNILNIWFNRKKEYLNLSGNKVMYSSVNGTMKIGFQKLFYMGAFGLVFSEALSQIIATFFFGKRFIRENGLRLFKTSREEIIQTMKKYKSFPMFSVPADFVNVFAKEMPVLMLSGFYGPSIVGFYMLNKRMLDAPLFLLSNSILEVFRQKATEDYNKYGNCRAIYVSTLKKLTLIGLIPFTILFFIAPMLFAFIFGDEWIVSGEFVRIFAIMYFVRFVSSPLSYVFYITNKLNLNLLLQILMLAIIWSCLYIGGNNFSDPKTTIILLSVGYTFIYGLFILVSFRLSKTRSRIY